MKTLKKIALFILEKLPWLLVIAVCIFGYIKCEGEKRANDNIATLQGEVSHYKNKVGGLTATVGTLQFTKKQLEQSILEKNDSLRSLADEFSRISHIIQTETVTEIDSIPVPYEVPVPFEFTRTGTKIDEWYSFDYVSNQNGLSLHNYKTWTETITIPGFKRKWFLGRQYATTDVTHTNPNITTVSIKSVEVIVPVRWYDTRVFNIALGALGTAILLKN